MVPINHAALTVRIIYYSENGDTRSSRNVGIIYQIIRRHISEDRNLRDNLQHTYYMRRYVDTNELQ